MRAADNSYRKILEKQPDLNKQQKYSIFTPRSTNIFWDYHWHDICGCVEFLKSLQINFRDVPLLGKCFLLVGTSSISPLYYRPALVSFWIMLVYVWVYMESLSHFASQMMTVTELVSEEY